MNLIPTLKKQKVVAVIRAANKEEAKKIVSACVLGGLTTIEITYTIPKASELLQELHDNYKDKIVLGAGTVLDQETCKEAIHSGAQFIVSPGFDQASARYCNENNIEYIPGCMTITEMLNATKAGANMIKLFPGSSFKPSFIKAVHGPLPEINIMPTGGITINNIKTWFEAGASAVGVGSSLTKYAKTNDFDTVTEVATQFAAIAKEVM